MEDIDNVKPVINQSYPAVSNADLDAAEKRIARSIPDEYRCFLLNYNGGWPEPSDFTVTFKDLRAEQISVEWFLPVNTSESIDLEKTLAAFNSRIHSDYFPIARVGGGSLICVRTGKEHAGKIYFWDREGESEDNEPLTEENLYFVAESFELFLDSLHD